LFIFSQEDILGLLKDAIYEKANKSSGFLIDGFPRRVDQGNKKNPKNLFFLSFLFIDA